MKKSYILSFWLLLLPMLFGCKETDIIFDIEQPRFETRDGLILLEVIAPYVTSTNDQIYIIGDFNGGLDAIGNPKWLLEKAPDTDVSVSKWGIYIDPKDYQNGKSLANGYTFYNVAMGEERSLENTKVTHTEVPAVGQRENVFIYLWQDHFNDKVDPDLVPHSGYTIYVADRTGYDYLALYGTTSGGQEVFGSWPGLATTGRISINGLKLKYFDTGYENEGKTVNLVFNNYGKGKQMPEYEVTLDRDYYLELTSQGDITEFDPSTYIAHDGYAVFVYNNTGWEELYMYMWGDVNDLNGGWPGMKPTGTQVVNNVVYQYFDFGEGATGLNENLIFNNNAAQLNDFNYTINGDLYVEITVAGVTVIDPETFNPSPSAPEPDQPETGQYTLYVQNETGWSPLYVYAYKTNSVEQIFGAWPGISSTDTEVIDGVTYTIFEVDGDVETNMLIFNDGEGGEGKQTGDFAIVLDRDYYLNVTSSYVTEITQSEEPKNYLYIEDNTGWSSFYVYAYSNDQPSLFGAWPGAMATKTTTINGTTYYVFGYDADGQDTDLIFHNGSGTQYDAMKINADQDYIIIANPTNAQLKGL